MDRTYSTSMQAYCTIIRKRASFTALILRHQGRIEESLTTFQAALCLNPTNVNNLKQVGRSLYLLGKHKTALDVFEEAEQLNSEDREIWHNKGMCYLYLKQYDKSLECFELANSIQRSEITYTQMGRVHRLQGATPALYPRQCPTRPYYIACMQATTRRR
jgi:tetratricopeptide (TPR) repeat protein